jgi:hypothetical protein
MSSPARSAALRTELSQRDNCYLRKEVLFQGGSLLGWF